MACNVIEWLVIQRVKLILDFIFYAVWQFILLSINIEIELNKVKNTENNNKDKCKTLHKIQVAVSLPAFG